MSPASHCVSRVPPCLQGPITSPASRYGPRVPHARKVSSRSHDLTMSPVSPESPKSPVSPVSPWDPYVDSPTVSPGSLESHHAPRIPQRPPLSPRPLIPRSPHVPRDPMSSDPLHALSLCHPLTSALPLGVSPVMLLALGADTAPEAGPALALPRHLQRERRAQLCGSPGAGRAVEPWQGAGGAHRIAGRVQGTRGVAATGLAASRSPQAPEVGCTAVAALAHHVGPAGTGARAAVASAGTGGAVGGQGSLWVAAAAYGWVGDRMGLSPYPPPRQCPPGTWPQHPKPPAWPRTHAQSQPP